ncbi:MAG: gamma-glutamyl-gamma-aminobutyrate hydrolase family protein [Pseudomonadota bacterium]
MPNPMVAVPCDRFVRRRLETSGTPASYLNALALVGLTPLQVPTIEEPYDVAPILNAVSGVLVTGARSNVHPSEYGAPESEAAAPFDLDRDRISLPMIREAMARGIPVFCICRGIQELNVAMGGTLHAEVHEVPGRAMHTFPPEDDIDAWFGLRHDIDIEEGGILRPILKSAQIPVNSLHYQAIDKLAPRARLEAVAPDGTVEAISAEGAPGFALGVQWHPEHTVKTDPNSRALFEAFAEAVREFHGRRARAAA